jgi:hypothetical protein
MNDLRRFPLETLEVEEREVIRQLRKLRKEVEFLLMVNGLAYGGAIAFLLASFLARIFR